MTSTISPGSLWTPDEEMVSNTTIITTGYLFLVEAIE